MKFQVATLEDGLGVSRTKHFAVEPELSVEQKRVAQGSTRQCRNGNVILFHSGPASDNVRST